MPYGLTNYTEFTLENKTYRGEQERTQEALMNLINNGFVLANFNGWDRNITGDELAQ